MREIQERHEAVVPPPQQPPQAGRPMKYFSFKNVKRKTFRRPRTEQPPFETNRKIDNFLGGSKPRRQFFLKKKRLDNLK